MIYVNDSKLSSDRKTIVFRQFDVYPDQRAASISVEMSMPMTDPEREPTFWCSLDLHKLLSLELAMHYSLLVFFFSSTIFETSSRSLKHAIILVTGIIIDEF